MPTEITAAEYRSKPESEASIQKRIVAAAKMLGWTVYHPAYSIGSDPGYPDLTCVHPTRGVLWLELKSAKGRVSERQEHWIGELAAAGQRAYVIFPQDEEFALALLRGEQPEGIRP